MPEPLKVFTYEIPPECLISPSIYCNGLCFLLANNRLYSLWIKTISPLQYRQDSQGMYFISWAAMFSVMAVIIGFKKLHFSKAQVLMTFPL